MLRLLAAAVSFALVPTLAAAQPPCTSDPKLVVDQIYNQILERPTRNDSGVWIQQLTEGTTVREVVRRIAHSPEHMQLVSRGDSWEERQRTANLLYRHLLGRAPDPGLRLLNMPRSAVPAQIDAIIDSREYAQQIGDWQVPGSTARYCRNGSNVAGNTGNWRADDRQFDRFFAADKNRDGRITISEWNDTRQAFRNADVNRDNVLTREEYVGAVGAVATTGFNREQRFSEMDRNRDGHITHGEWRGSADAFEWLDRNEDGELSRGEVLGNGRVP
jgi:hypothetical protein